MGFHKEQEKKSAKTHELAKDTVAMKIPTALPLNEYAGNYLHEVYGKMNISNESGQLIMRFEHHKRMFGILEPLGGNRFYCTYSDPLYGKKKLQFTVENNKVKSLTVRVADFVEFTPYEFIKVE